MERDLDELIKLAQKHPMSTTEQERQRRSFVYGNTRIANERITREMVEEAAEDAVFAIRQGGVFVPADGLLEWLKG